MAMNTPILGWLAAAAMLFAAAQMGCAEPAARGAGPATEPAAGGQRAFAVVELFTSEGCSSCPPADAVLTRIVERADQQKLPILALSFHVDYWDRLGWKDPFSSADATARQHQYAAAFSSDEIYTPQMFVNGGRGFVGSREKDADAQIETALKEPSRVELTLSARMMGNARCSVSYHATGAEKGQVIHVALVERHAVSEVRRGENAGRKLPHSNVVRFFTTQAAAAPFDGNVEIPLPAGLDAQGAFLAAYIQDGVSMKIVGSALIALPHLPGSSDP